MDGYKIVNLLDFYDALGDERAAAIISEFSCPLNADIEYFIEQKAYDFARQGWAATQLVLAPHMKLPVIVGYFSIANKSICVHDKQLSKTMAKRLHKFSSAPVVGGVSVIAAPLIAQIGKNYANGYEKLIKGEYLLRFAFEKIQITQGILGGKFIYVECEEVDRLIDFYRRYGFVDFGTRDLDADELSQFSCKRLVQLIKYMR